MLYVFAGFPGKARLPGSAYLNAGGLQHCIEEVENLAILEHDPAIQYSKEGVFVVGGAYGERQGPVEYRLSKLLERDGITWDWFPEHYGFGQGVSMPKSTANRETMLVDYDSGMGIPDLIATRRIIDLGKLRIQMVPKRTEGWDKYEARWAPHTCPQESHIVHITCVITKHHIPEFAYLRLEQIIENPGAELRDVERYQPRHWSLSRKWEGEAYVPPSKEFVRLMGGLR